MDRSIGVQKNARIRLATAIERDASGIEAEFKAYEAERRRRTGNDARSIYYARIWAADWAGVYSENTVRPSSFERNLPRIQCRVEVYLVTAGDSRERERARLPADCRGEEKEDSYNTKTPAAHE